MEKICLIRQPAGIGDIFFCQKIAKIIKVIWPVASTYAYLNQYMEGDIDFCEENTSFEFKDVYLSHHRNIIQSEKLLYIPLQFADSIIKMCRCHNNPLAFCHMKYDLCNMSYEDWANYFEFKRDRQRETELVEKLRVNLSTPFNLINRNFGTYPNYITRTDLVPKNSYPNVYMGFYEGVNLFDWLTLVERAYEIHTVGTSLAFILEKLKLKNVNLYSRYSNFKEDFSDIKNKDTQEWIYIN
jgi:hypothetical protein